MRTKRIQHALKINEAALKHAERMLETPGLTPEEKEQHEQDYNGLLEEREYLKKQTKTGTTG